MKFAVPLVALTALAVASFFFFRDGPLSPSYQDKTEQHENGALELQPVAITNPPAAIPAAPASQPTAQAGIPKPALSDADSGDGASNLDAEPVMLGGDSADYGSNYPEAFEKYDYEPITLNPDALFNIELGQKLTFSIPQEATTEDYQVVAKDVSQGMTSITAKPSPDTSNRMVLTVAENGDVFGEVITTDNTYVLIGNQEFSVLIDADTFYRKPTEVGPGPIRPEDFEASIERQKMSLHEKGDSE